MAEVTRENALKAMRVAYERGDKESALRMAALAKQLEPLPETKTAPAMDAEQKVDTFNAPVKQAAKAADDLPPDVPSQEELDAYHAAKKAEKNEFEQFFGKLGSKAVELLNMREDAKETTRAMIQNVGASAAAGTEAVGRMAASPVTGETFSDVADTMQSNIEQWGYSPQREGAKKALENVGKVFEPIDSATFRAGSVFEDIPVVGPAVATGVKVGADMAIGALAGRMVSGGMKAASAKRLARAQVNAERAAKAERQAAANAAFKETHRKKKMPKTADEITEDTDPTGVLKSKRAFVRQYVKDTMGSDTPPSVRIREAETKWKEYMKQSMDEEDMLWDAARAKQTEALAKNPLKRTYKDTEILELPKPVKGSKRGKGLDGVGDFLGTVVSRLDSIDPSRTLSNAIRMMEFNIEKKMVFRNAALEDFYNISKKMYKSPLKDNWHRAYMAQDWDELKALAITQQVKPNRWKAFDGDYDSTFNSVRSVLDDMGGEALESGFRDFALIKGYLPRHITEDKLAALAEDPRFNMSVGPDKVSKIRKAMNGTYDDYSTRMEAINGAILGGGNAKVPVVTAAQSKKRAALLPVEYYEPGHVAIQRYINDMTESVEVRKFLGRNKANLDDSLGAFIEQQSSLMQLTPKEEMVLKNVLEARFKEGRMHTPRFWQGVKNFGYITSIGNVWSTITQLGDILSSMRTLGVRNTVGGLTDIVRGKGIRTGDVGYEQIMKELADPSKSSEWLDRALIVSGFKQMDKFGKRTIVNASKRKFQKQALTEKGRARIAEQYSWLAKKDPEAYGQFIDDLAKGDISNDNVKLAIFNDLADLQPITLSDMPLSYLKNPRGRVLWALKTWQAQQLNTLYRHTVQEFKRGNKGRAAGNFLKFATFNIMLGTAGIDTFKEWLAKAAAGEDITAQDITDNVSEAWMRTAFISRYSIEKSQGGADFWHYATDIAAPSLQGTINRAERALKKEGAEAKTKELFKLLPIVGAPYAAYERAKEDK